MRLLRDEASRQKLCLINSKGKRFCAILSMLLPHSFPVAFFSRTSMVRPDTSICLEERKKLQQQQRKMKPRNSAVINYLLLPNFQHFSLANAENSCNQKHGLCSLNLTSRQRQPLSQLSYLLMKVYKCHATVRI